MKSYEDFLVFLEEHLYHISDFISPTDKDFFSVCTATARFLLSEPYRWHDLIKTWPNLPQIEPPTQEQVLEFLNSTKGLKASFRKELENNDRESLKEAYNLLFPILVLKDDFLASVYRKEIQSRRFKTIFRESKKKIPRVIKYIDRMKNDENFLQLMEKFTRDLSGFSLTIINNRKLLDQVVNKLAQREN